MAEIITQSDSGRQKSLSRKGIQVDLTPMVDLAFLLITFFMLVTSFEKPNVMNLGLPAKSPGPITEAIDFRNQVTFILGENRIFYYQKDASEFSASDLHELDTKALSVAKTVQQYRTAAPRPEIFTVIIKPTSDANYSNFVDMLDELQIAKAERYGITDLNAKEKEIYGNILK